MELPRASAALQEPTEEGESRPASQDRVGRTLATGVSCHLMIFIGWSKSRNKFDLLHVCYLGFGRDLIGSMLVITSKLWYPRASLERGLAELFVNFRTWCRTRRISCTMKVFSLSTVGMQSSGERVFPVLSSRIKAAKVRTMIKWMVQVARESRHLDGTASENRYIMMSELGKFIHLCGTDGIFMVHAEAAVKNGRAFLLAYQAEVERNHKLNKLLFKVRPKLHYFSHLIDFLSETRENPASQDTFLYESFCGKVKRIVAKTHRDTSGVRGPQRYLLALAVRWRSLPR